MTLAAKGIFILGLVLRVITGLHSYPKIATIVKQRQYLTAILV